jgi:transcriptional regulator with XRE-family HTH domain
MNVAVQRFMTPEGTEMVVLPAKDFERLQALAEDGEDVMEARAALARIEAGEGTMPGEVLGAILDDGLHPIAAWRRYRGLSQAELARRTGLSQVWLSRIESGGGTGSAATRAKLATALEAPVWALESEEGSDEMASRVAIAPIYDNFRSEIQQRLTAARNAGLASLELSSGEIHRGVGGYPGTNHRMPECCRALRDVAHSFKAELLSEPPKGLGASLRFKFVL